MRDATTCLRNAPAKYQTGYNSYSIVPTIVSLRVIRTLTYLQPSFHHHRRSHLSISHEKISFQTVACDVVNFGIKLLQRYRIFFFTAKVGGPFIQSKPKMVYFFFPAKRKKKIQLVLFFFPGKVHRSFIRSFDEFLFFLIKDGCVFFFRNFVVFFCVFFFSWKSSQVIHSFNFLGGKKKTTREKKKTAFSFIHSKILKNAQKRTFPGK